MNRFIFKLLSNLYTSLLWRSYKPHRFYGEAISCGVSLLCNSVSLLWRSVSLLYKSDISTLPLYYNINSTLSLLKLEKQKCQN